jgi:hypothetical protein
VTLSWLSHILLDFGFTPFPYLTSPVWFFPLSEIAVYSIDQISAFIISVLFGCMLLSYFNPFIYVDPFRNIKTTDLQKKEHDRAEVDDYLEVTGLVPFSRQIVKIHLVEHKIVTILVILAVILGAIITIVFSLQ